MDPQDRLRLLAASVILLQALDLVSTAFGLAMGHLESNPLVAAYGWLPLVLLKFACVLALIGLPLTVAAMAPDKRGAFLKPTNRALAFTVIFYGIVVLGNLAVAA